MITKCIFKISMQVRRDEINVNKNNHLLSCQATLLKGLEFPRKDFLFFDFGFLLGLKPLKVHLFHF